MLLFDETDDIGHLDSMRSLSIGLAVFFIFCGGYLFATGRENGGWMILGGLASAFVAWDAHRAMRVVENPMTLRKKMGYSPPAIGENMAYDKEAKSIVIDGNEKQLQKDIFKHFESVLGDLAKDPNCPPDIKKQHEDYRRANKAVNDAETLRAQINRMAAAQTAENQKGKFARFIGSKPGRIAVVLGVAWSIYVVFRTAGNYEVLGIELLHWNEDYFLLNWLGMPVAIACLWAAWRWVAKAKA